MHNLDQILDEVREKLYASALLPRPTISWSEQDITTYFGTYHLYNNHITISKILNSKDISYEAISSGCCIARVLYFFEKHWEELLKFSRRNEAQLNRWAARYGYKEKPREILDHAKKGYGGGRYTSVNLGNTETIEFRIFRGTLKYNTLIATLQLLDKVCDVALFMSDEQLKGLS